MKTQPSGSYDITGQNNVKVKRDGKYFKEGKTNTTEQIKAV